MAKKSLSIMSKSYTDSIKNLDNNMLKKIQKGIEKLEREENEYFEKCETRRIQEQNGQKVTKETEVQPHLRNGNYLTAMNNNNIYVLKVGFDRAIATVLENEKEKIYVWFWGGSHEEYNKLLKAKMLNDKGNTVSQREDTKTAIKTKIDELRKSETKPDNKNDKRYFNNHTGSLNGVEDTVYAIRDKYSSKNAHGKKNK